MSSVCICRHVLLLGEVETDTLLHLQGLLGATRDRLQSQSSWTNALTTTQSNAPQQRRCWIPSSPTGLALELHIFDSTELAGIGAGPQDNLSLSKYIDRSIKTQDGPMIEKKGSLSGDDRTVSVTHANHCSVCWQVVQFDRAVFHSHARILVLPRNCIACSAPASEAMITPDFDRHALMQQPSLHSKRFPREY